MSKSKSALSTYLDFLNLPPGLLHAVSSIYKSQNVRIFLLDNSHSMRRPDSTLMRAEANFTKIEKKEGVSRWAELSQCVEFHAKMAARCHIPTQFRLVNEESSEDTPRKFGVCWSGKSSPNDEKDAAIGHMKNVKLEQRVNPLARQIRKVEKYLSGEVDKLRKREEFVSVVVCTHGIPTDEAGKVGKAVTKDFIDSLGE
jgi:hypothetical protein